MGASQPRRGQGGVSSVHQDKGRLAVSLALELLSGSSGPLPGLWLRDLPELLPTLSPPLLPGAGPPCPSVCTWPRRRLASPRCPFPRRAASHPQLCPPSCRQAMALMCSRWRLDPTPRHLLHASLHPPCARATPTTCPACCFNPCGHHCPQTPAEPQFTDLSAPSRTLAPDSTAISLVLGPTR